MNILQAVLSSRGVQVARIVILASISAALVSGFFVPNYAFALPTPTTLTITGPNGGEEWRSTHNITWDSTGGISGDTVSLVYSTNDFVTSSLIVGSEGLPFEGGSFSWNTATVPDGGGYKVKVVSANGLVYDPSNDSFIVDNTAPTSGYSISPEDPSESGWYNIATGIPTVTLSCDDGLIGSGCNGTSYKWNADDYGLYSAPFTTGLLQGVNTLYFYSKDVAVDSTLPTPVNNVEVPQTREIKVDTETPTVAVSSDTADGFYNAGDAIDVTLTFSEAVWSLTGVTVSLDSGGSCSTGAFSGTAEVSCTYTVASGHNSSDLTASGLSGTVVDIAGNPADLDLESNINEESSIVVDTVAPALLTLGDVDTEGGTVRYGWWNSTNTGVEVIVPVDDDSSLEGGTIQLQAKADLGAFANIGSAYTITAGDIEDGSVTLNLSAAEVEAISGFTEGSVLSFTAVITDRADNSTTQTQSSDTLTVDQVAPDVDAGSDREVNAATDQDDAEVSDAAPSSGTLVYLWSQVSGEAGSVTFGDSDEVNPTISLPATDGTDDDTYGLLLTATDAAGNSASDGITFVWDTTKPELDEIMPVASPTNDTTPDYVFSVDNTGWLPGHSGGAITYGGSCRSATATAVAGSNTITLTQSDIGGSPFIDGTYSDCTIAVTDAAGNVSTDDDTDPLAIDEFEVDTISAITSGANITTEEAGTPDGRIDRATIVFDDPVDDITFVPADFTIGGVAADGFDTGEYANDNIVVLLVGGGVSGTEAKTVAYGSTAKDLAGNSIAPFTYTSTDAAGPVPLTARTIDTTHITVTFSEDLDGSSDGTSDFAVSGHTLAGGGTDETAAGVITLTLGETMGTGDTPSVTVNGDGESGLEDLNGNWSPNAYVRIPSDGVAPVLTDVSITSDNDVDTDAPEWAKVGDVVTLTFTSSEAIETPVVTIGVGSAVIEEIEVNMWSATRTMTADDEDGIVTFSIAFEDVVEPANMGTTVTATNDGDPGSWVLFDKANPDVNAGPLNEVNEDVFQDATMSDEEMPGGSGIASWEWSFEQIAGATGGVVSFSPSSEGESDDSDVMISADTDGVYELTLTVTDNAGNVGSHTTTLIWDTMAPRLHYTIPNSGSTGVPTAEDEMNAFFRELNHGEYAENIVLLDENRVFLEDTTGGAVQDNVEVDDDDGESNRLNIEYNELDNGTMYCLTILAGAVRDVAGNETEQDITGPCFTTEEDTEPPFLTLLTMEDIDALSATVIAETNESAVCQATPLEQAFDGDDEDSMMDPAEGGLSHSLTLTDLDPETLYNVYVRCQDTEDNTMTNSGHVQFATGNDDTDAPPAPVITTTDEITVNSDTFVITGTLGEGTPEDSHTITVYNGLGIAGTISLVSGQSAWGVVVPLPQNATSTFTATATDEAGNVSDASNTVDIGESDAIGAPDTTAPDAPAITTDVPEGTVDADTFTLSGTASDDGGTRIVTIYRNSAPVAVGSTVLAAGETAWSASVPLTQNTGNTFNARSIDEVGNESGASDSVTITEASADSAAPAITDTAVTDVTSGGATLTVTTDGEAACKVGSEDVAYGSLPYDLTPVSPTSYTYAFGELNDNTTYDFYVRCQDGSGNTSDSAHVTFTTLSNDDTAPTISDIQTTSIGLDTVTVEWITDEPSTSRVEYGTSSAYGESTATTDTGEEEDDEMTTEHSVTIGELDSSTTYHFRVHSIDDEDNEGTSGDNTFATDADDTAAGLHVDGVTNVRTAAIANDEWADGWAWTFRITVPSDETDFWMSFTDFAGTDAENIIPADGNVRYYSAQSTNADTSEDAIVISEANEYPEDALMVDTEEDLDATTPGIQIEVRVEVKVPEDTEEDTYSASYRIRTEGSDDET